MAKNQQRAPKKKKRKQYVSRRQRFTNITIWVIIVAFLGGGVIFFTPGGLQIFDFAGGDDTEPVLHINGKTINSTEFAFATARASVNYAQSQQTNLDEAFAGASGARAYQQVRNDAIDNVTRETLMLEEARKRGIGAPNTELDPRVVQAYNSFFTSQGYTEEQLREFLDENLENRQSYQQYLFQAGIANTRNGTMQELRRAIRENQEKLLKEEKLREEVVGEINPTDLELIDFVEEREAQYRQQVLGNYEPTDEEIETYYNENLDEYAGDQVEVRHIMLRLPPGYDADDVQSYSAKLERLQASLAAGGDFVELALANSEDVLVASNEGNLGFITHGRSRFDSSEDTSFSDAVFDLAIGETTIVQSPQGLHLVEVTDRRTNSFEDVKSRVRGDLVEEVQSERFATWLEDARTAGEFPKTPEVKARHILFSLPQDATEEAVQSVSRKVDRVVVELKDGADFEELANQHTEDPSGQSRQNGGDLGWFGRGSMVPAFEDIAFSLEINEISEPVRTQFGFHIIQVTDKRESDTLRENVARTYTAEQEREIYREWVEGLIESAEVVIEEPLLRAYAKEDEARDVEDPQLKLELYIEALQYYEEAKADIAVTDQYIGYYESEVHRLKLNVLEGQLAELGADASEEERAQLEEQIAIEQEQLSNSFLESVNAYTEIDDQAFQRTVAEDRDNAELRFQYALFIYTFKTDHEGAFEQLQEVIDLDPDNWQALDWSARIELERENYGSAVAFLRNAIELAGEENNQTQFLELRLAQALLEDAKSTGNEETLAEAEQVLLDLTTAFMTGDRSGSIVQERLGDVYYAQERYADAIEAYNLSLDGDPDNPRQVQIKLGRSQLEAGDLNASESTLEDVVQNDAYSVDARIAVGDVYIAQNREDEALRSYRDALALPTDALGQEVDYEKRVEIATKILDIEPSDTETRFTLAQIYIDEAILDQAIGIYQQILDSDPDSWEAQKGLGIAHQTRNEFNPALEFFQSALQNDPPQNQEIDINTRIIEIDEIQTGNDPLSEVGQQAILNLAQIYTDLEEEIQAREQLKILQDEYPDFQPERVAEMIAFLNDSRPGEFVESQGGQHIATGQEHEPYQTFPPTSGPHIGNNIAPYGISTTPLPNELQIHNLEHGAVIIHYQDVLDQPIVDQLTDYVNNLRREQEYCKVMLAPYTEMENAITLTAWTRLLRLDAFDEEAMTNFIDEYINEGPEDINDCRL